MTRITEVRTASLTVALERPVRIGGYEVRARDYVIAAVRTEGTQGIAFALARQTPIGAIVDNLVAPHYLGQAADDPRRLFAAAQAAHPTVLTAGLGLRALSIVDLAAWDFAAKLTGQDIIAYLGGTPADLPKIALVGYPPDASRTQVAEEVRERCEQGWQRFKMPIAPTRRLTRERLEAVRQVAGEAELMLDAAWSWESVSDATAYVEYLADLELAWVEDPFLPGDVISLAALRTETATPIAAGDEQGGGYFPDALLQAAAVDVLRIDATCAGGATTFSSHVEQAKRSGVRLSTHIFPLVHGALACGFGAPNATIEWGLGNGVDPLSEAVRPVAGGGFGLEFELGRLGSYELDDPHGLFVRT